MSQGFRENLPFLGLRKKVGRVCRKSDVIKEYMIINKSSYSNNEMFDFCNNLLQKGNFTTSMLSHCRKGFCIEGLGVNVYPVFRKNRLTITILDMFF